MSISHCFLLPRTTTDFSKAADWADFSLLGENVRIFATAALHKHVERFCMASGIDSGVVSPTGEAVFSEIPWLDVKSLGTRGSEDMKYPVGTSKVLFLYPSDACLSEECDVAAFSLNINEALKTEGTLLHLFNNQHGALLAALVDFARLLAELDSRVPFPTNWKQICQKLTFGKTIHYTLPRPKRVSRVSSRVYARIGLMGNPSDGFHGKTLATTIENFWATVTVTRKEGGGHIEVVPHPLFDAASFHTLEELDAVVRVDGCHGGRRLLLSSLSVFFQQFRDSVSLDEKFSIEYETSIPRQVGLAGSSAIVCASLKALKAFFGIPEVDFPPELMASLALKAESEVLGIAAGLQDRVAQSYGGLVLMDFEKSHLEEKGYGIYSTQADLLKKALDSPIDEVPRCLFLAFCLVASDSGKAHSDVKQRFLEGDKAVLAAMQKFGALTEMAVEALEQRDCAQFASLMSANFQLRVATYGEECIGKTNLQLIDIARSCGAHSKFPGSGGAVIGVVESSRFQELKTAYAQQSFVCIKVKLP